MTRKVLLPARRRWVARWTTAAMAYGALAAASSAHSAARSAADRLPPIPITFAVDAGLPVLREASAPETSTDSFFDKANRLFDEQGRLLAARRFAAALVAEADRLLGPSLGRSFRLAAVRLWSPDATSLEDRLDDLRTKVGPVRGGIVAGLTGPLERSGTGLASYREGLLVVAAPPARHARLFVHELAHLFGAVHRPGTAGLMAAEDPGEALDPVNARIVALHRERRFDPRLFPLPAEALEAARLAYLEAATAAPEADALLAPIALERGDPTGALEAAERLLAGDPENLEVRVVRGIALRRLGRAAEAAAEYERVLARRPGYAPAHYNLAIALDHLGQSDRALGAYERALELDPTSASAWSNLARLLARRGAAERARAAARRALELAPEHTGARVNLAMAQLEAGDSVSAESEARQAVAERPDMAVAHEALGGALLAGGRPEAAAAAFRRAAELEAGEPRFRSQEAVALRGLARSRRAAGDLDRAQAALERATRLVPDDAEAWSERAQLAFERGRRAEAREAYRELLRLRPGDGAAHNNLAVVLFRSGDVAGARRHVEAAQRLGLAVHPDFLRALAEAERR